MEITTNIDYTITATEGYWLTQKEVEFDNFRTFSKSFTVFSEEEANLYEEWCEEKKNEFEGIENVEEEVPEIDNVMPDDTESD